MEIWVNGAFRPLDQPALAARDGGFLYGEAVYEGVKIVARRPLFLAEHLARLALSAAALDLPVPLDAAAVCTVLGRLLHSAGRDDALARVYLTRGAPDGAPGALLWLDSLPPYAASDTPPWRLTCHDERIVPYQPAVKHTNRLVHAAARRKAIAAGADDALLVHRDGWVLEGTASNVFFFESDTLHTPEPGCGILSGITRDQVLALAPGCGFRTVEGRYPAPILAAADECFLTFTSAGVKPVAALDGKRFPAPVPGRRTERLAAAYAGRVAEALAQTPPC
ncbi:MAG: aminotransferase class IV [Gemmatimonadota bacterium]